MSDIKKAIAALQEGILSAIDKKIKNAPYDKTVQGRVGSVLGNGKYEVMVNGTNYTVRSRFELNVGEFVWIMFPCGNSENMLIIG